MHCERLVVWLQSLLLRRNRSRRLRMHKVMKMRHQQLRWTTWTHPACSTAMQLAPPLAIASMTMLRLLRQLSRQRNRSLQSRRGRER